MTKFITSIEIIGLHGQFDFFCEFQEGVNVIYGRNGAGKTTLLHILANVLNGDFLRFAAINFSRIEVEFSKGTPVIIELKKIQPPSHPFRYQGFIQVNGQLLHEREFDPRDLEEFFGDKPRRARARAERSREVVTISEEVMSKLPHIELSAAYFPAFRTAIDAWAVNVEEEPMPRELRRRGFQREKTIFARSLFGQFVPNLDYPATSEIEEHLNNQIRTAIANVSQADRTYFGDVPSRILEAVAQKEVPTANISDILAEIESLSKRFQEYPIQVESMWDKLSESVQSVPNDQDSQRVTKTVLNSYREALKRIVDIQEESFAAVEKYLSSVNVFLEGKNMEMNSLTPVNRPSVYWRNTPSVVIRHDDANLPAVSMTKALSSGERQITTLLYAATRLNKQDVILIDEPEISLNVDWQRKLLPEMQKQMPSKQLIVCTHSPVVGAKYREAMIKLSPTATKNPEPVFPTIEEDFDEFSDIN